MMAAVISIAIWVLVAVLALFVLVLVMPLHIVLIVTKEDEWRLSGTLRPFGRFGPRIAMSKPQKKAKTLPSVKRKDRKKRRKWTRKPQGIVRAAMRLVADLIRCVRLNAATIDLTFGLGDPGETGQVFGMMTPLIYAPCGTERVRLNVVPVFDRAMMRGRMAIDLSIVPVALLAPIARFGWTTFGPRQ